MSVLVNQPDEREDTPRWMGIYHPFWINKEKGERNPQWDEFSERILDVKKAYGRGVRYFVPRLDSILRKGIAVAIVPSHDPSKRYGGMELIARALVKAGRVDATNLLIRTHLISKLSGGGNRSLKMHLESIVCQEPARFNSTEIVLLDDVYTTGNSLAACWQILKKAGCPYVLRFALGRTVR